MLPLNQQRSGKRHWRSTVKPKTTVLERSFSIFSYLLLGLSLSALVHAQDRFSYTLQINSTGLNVKQETLGHAFMIIKVRTNQGVKEEAFGFYSEREATGVRDLPRLIIGTPGTLRSEFDRHPERFQRVDETLEIPITAEQRQGIYKVVNEWNTHHYNLRNENCITFVDKVATKIGLPVPSRLSYATADQYISALRTSYQ